MAIDLLRRVGVVKDFNYRATRTGTRGLREEESTTACRLPARSTSKFMLRQSAAAPATRERFPPEAPV